MFHFWSPERRTSIFDRLWTNPAPTHHGLAELLRDPRDLHAAAGPRPGSPCPLCGFATFDWADPAQLTQETLSALLKEFSAWTPGQGICGRCADVYRVIGLDQQATLARVMPA